MTSLLPLNEPVDGLQHLLTSTQHQLSILSTSYADAETKRLLINMRDKLFRAAQKAESERLKMTLSTDIDNEPIHCEDVVNIEDKESQINEAFMTVLLTDISFAWGETMELNNTISLLDVVEDSIYKTFQCICAETKSESIIDILLISLYETDKAVTIVRSYLQKLGKSGMMEMGQSQHFDNKELNQIKQIAKLPTVLQTARRVCHSDSYIKVGIKRRRITRDRSKDHYEQSIWKTPFVYWLVTMVGELQQRKNELCQEIKTNETTVDCIVQATKSCSRIFPRLRNSVYEHAGIAFFLLDSSILTSADNDNDRTKVFLVDLTLERVTVALRQDQNIALSLLEYAIGSFSLYNVTARCVEMLFERISIDSTNVIVNACNQLFRCCSLDKENYLQQLPNVLEQSRVDENSSDTRKRFRTMEDKDESVYHALFKIRQPAYPVLVHINLLLLENCDQTIRQAVCLAKHVEDSPHVSVDYKREIYANLFAFFAMHNYFFDESRSVEMSVQVMVVPHLGPIGMDVIFNRLLDLANFIEDCDDGNKVTVGEKYYVSLACQQTVLQSLISKYGHREGWSIYMQEYSESAGALKPDDVLRKPNPVPESIVCFNPANGKLVPDVFSLLLRGENSQTNQNSSHLVLLSDDNEILFSPLAKTNRQDILVNETAKKVTFNTCNETDVNNELTENEPLYPLMLLEHSKDPLGTITDSIDQTNIVTFESSNNNLLSSQAKSTGYSRHEDDFIEVEHSFNAENDNEIDEFYDAFDASEENHDAVEECLIETNEETQNYIDLGSEDSGSEEGSHADDSESASAVDATETATNLNYEDRNLEHLQDEEVVLDEQEDEIVGDEEDVLDEHEDEVERDEEDVFDEDEIEFVEEDVPDRHDDENEEEETEEDSVSSSNDEVDEDGDDSGNQDNLPAENEVVIIDSSDDEESNQSYSENSCDVSDQNVGSPMVHPAFSGIRRDSSSNFQEENFSQVDAGYDAEDSQGQATEEDEERYRDSEYNSNAITSSSSKLPLNLHTDNYNPSIERASDLVDMGYEAEDSQDHTDVEDDRRSKRLVTRFVETGYEAEDSQEQSEDEEDVSEAIQSEDDVDNFKSSTSPVFPRNANINESMLESPRIIKNRYSTSGMSADDERTATELEDGGAESSEYDDVVVDEKVPRHYLKTAVEERQGSSLQDYAAAVQRADACQIVSAEQHDIEVGDHVDGADNVLRNVDNADVEDAQLLLQTSAGVSFALEKSILDARAPNNYIESPSLDPKQDTKLEKSAIDWTSHVIADVDSSASPHFSEAVITAKSVQKDSIGDFESGDVEAKLDIESNVPLGAEHSSNEVFLIQGADIKVHTKQMNESTKEQASQNMECALSQENDSETVMNLNIEGACYGTATEVTLLKNSELMSQYSQPPNSEALTTGTELDTSSGNNIEIEGIENDVSAGINGNLETPDNYMRQQTLKSDTNVMETEAVGPENDLHHTVHLSADNTMVTDDTSASQKRSNSHMDLLISTEMMVDSQTEHNLTQAATIPIQQECIVNDLPIYAEIDTPITALETSKVVKTNGLDSPKMPTARQHAELSQSENIDSNVDFRVNSAESADLVPIHQSSRVQKEGIVEFGTNLNVGEDNTSLLTDSSPKTGYSEDNINLILPREGLKTTGKDASDTVDYSSNKQNVQQEISDSASPRKRPKIGELDESEMKPEPHISTVEEATISENLVYEIPAEADECGKILLDLHETQPAQNLVACNVNNGKGTFQSEIVPSRMSNQSSVAIGALTANVDDHSGAHAIVENSVVEEFNDEEGSKSSRLSKRKKKIPITTPSKSTHNTRSAINSRRKASLPEELVIEETAIYNDNNMEGVPGSLDNEISQNLFASHSHEGDTIRKSDELLDQKSVSSRVSNRSRAKSVGKPLLSAARTRLAKNTGKDIVVSTIPSHEATSDLDDQSVANSYAESHAAIGTIDHEGALPQPAELNEEETSKSTRRSSRQKKSSNNTQSNSIRSTRSATKTKIMDLDDAVFQKSSVADCVSNLSWSKSGRAVENTGKDIYVPTNPTHDAASDIDDHSEASSYVDKLESFRSLGPEGAILHEESHDEEVSKTSRRSTRQKKSTRSTPSNSVRSLRSATKTKQKVLSPDHVVGDKTGTYNENIEAAIYSPETELPIEIFDNHSNKKDAIAKSDNVSVQKSVAKKVSNQSSSKPVGKPPLPTRARRSVPSTGKDVVVPTIPVHKADSDVDEDTSLQLDAQHDEEGSKSSRRSNRQKKNSISALSNSVRSTRSATKTNEDLLPEDVVGRKTAADTEHLETIDAESPQELLDNHSNKEDAKAESDDVSVQDSVASRLSHQSRSKSAGKPHPAAHRTRRSVASTGKDVVVPTITVQKSGSDVDDRSAANLYAENPEVTGIIDQEVALPQPDEVHDEETSKSSRRPGRPKKSSISTPSSTPSKSTRSTRSATKVEKRTR